MCKGRLKGVEMVTSALLTNGISRHIILLVFIAIFIPISTIWGFRKELRLIEQVIAISVIFLLVEFAIFLLPYLK